MPSIADVYVNVLPSTRDIKPGIAKAFREVDSDAREAGRRWGREIRSGMGDVEVDIDADTTKARNEIRQLDREVSRRRTVDIDTGAATSQITELGSTIAGVGRSAGSVGMAALVPVLTGVVGVAAQASQALWMLPGALGAVGTAVATLKIGMLGFEDALSNMGDAEKFAESLKSLAPNAQQAALAIQALKPAFDGLKGATQNALFANVGPQLNQLTGAMLPMVQQATTGIAGAFNSMFSGVVQQLMSPETMAAIQTTLQNVAAAFQQLAPAAAPFTKALSEIMAVGSGALPAIGTAITQAATAFSSFITEASRSGQLQEWLGSGLDAIKQLIPMVGDLGTIFFAMAPIGERVLPLIADSLNIIARVMPTIATVTAAISPLFRTWEISVGAVGLALGAIEGIVRGVGNAVIPVINSITNALNAMLGPIRAAASLVGINIPEFSAINATAAAVPATLGGGANAQRERRGLAPVAVGTVPGVPAGGYTVPTTMTPGLGSGFLSGSASARVQPYTWGNPAPASSGGGGGGSASAYSAPSGYVSDSALLANVPAGTYDSSGDLAQGLGDCSSAVEDLVNMMDGRTTAGRSMSTSNAAEWLTAHGFLPGNMPGAFNVGYNGGHMQATLPGGTNFNWGSDAAAARGGVGGTGASDPSLTAQYYRPVAGSSPLSSAYPAADSDVSGYLTGDPKHDKRVREAGQRVDDTAAKVADQQARLDEINAKGTATARQRADAERDLAVAKREHADAQTDLNAVMQDGGKVAGSQGSSSVEQLGKDFGSGLLEIFGFDGSLFKSPADFGLMKILQGVMGLSVSDGTGGGGSPGAGGGGGGTGLIGGLLSMAPKAFGDLNIGSPKDAPGQFMPSLGSGGGGGTGGGFASAIVNQGGGAPGAPPVVDQRVDMRGANFGHSAMAVQKGIASAQLQQTRQPLRALPG